MEVRMLVEDVAVCDRGCDMLVEDERPLMSWARDTEAQFRGRALRLQ